MAQKGVWSIALPAYHYDRYPPILVNFYLPLRDEFAGFVGFCWYSVDSLGDLIEF